MGDPSVLRVAFRVEASARIGTGHLMRCLTLADALARRGAACHFLARDWGPQRGLVLSRGHEAVTLPAWSSAGAPAPDPEAPPHADWLGGPWQEDAEQTRLQLARIGAGWLVVDHYALTAAWERAVRSGTRYLVVIDDLADRPHDCDLLLDANAHAEPAQRYRHRVNPAARCLFGPRYALLRDEFLQARKTQPPPPQRRSLFIGFGGADADNLTLRSVRAAAALCAAGAPCDVVVGASYPHLDSLRQALAAPAHAATRLHVATDQVAQCMGQARMAVCGGGVSTWERMCMGLPSLVMAAADNQVEALRHLQDQGWIRLLGRADDVSDAALAHEIQAFWQASESLARMAAQGVAVVDGQGASRVVAEMLAFGPGLWGQASGDAPSPVFLAPLQDTHLERLTAWKNDPGLAHQIAAHPAQFSGTQVREWMQRNAADPDQLFLGIFARTDAAVIGVARLMFIDWVSGVAELGIFIGEPTARGQGQGRAAVQLLLRRAFGQLGLHRVFLRVMVDNLAAIRCYRACGFTEEGRLRDHFTSRGVRHDMLVMGVLRTELPAVGLDD